MTYTLEIQPQPALGEATVDVSIGFTQQFYAHLKGSDGSDVVVAATWSTTSGSINQNGLLTAGPNLDAYTVTAHYAGGAGG